MMKFPEIHSCAYSIAWPIAMTLYNLLGVLALPDPEKRDRNRSMENEEKHFS
jgi:hypothetical protein